MAEQQTKLRINWRKFPLGVLALVSIVAVPITVVLGITSVINFGWFFAALAATALSLGMLRYTAITQRHKKYGYHPVSTVRVNAARQVPGLVAIQGDDAPFDAIDTVVTNKETLEHETALDAEPAAVEENQTPQQSPTQVKENISTWEPVEVPEPSYLRSAKIERAEPEPLELPETPQPTVNRLKDTLAAPEADEDDLEAQQRQIHKSVRPNQTKPGALNLDDVLDRRRA